MISWCVLKICCTSVLCATLIENNNLVGSSPFSREIKEVLMEGLEEEEDPFF